MGYFGQAVKGTGWMTALRAITRGLGFVKIAILARILTPEDFGLFGIAALALAFLETFTEPGVSLALIQQEEDIDDYVSTAWIISIARGLLISLLMVSFSGAIAGFFNRPDAVLIILLASAIPFVRGFINPSAVNFVKNLEFKKEFILKSIPATFDIITAIILSLVIRSPIAIIYGMLMGAVVEVIMTFVMTEIRPAFKFVKSQAKKLLGFGKWVTAGFIMSYLSENFDDIVVGRFLGATSLGIYQMAFKLSVLPSVELAQIISKVIFPVYSKIAGDKQRIKKAMYKTTAVLIGVAAPISFVIALFPESIIKVVLGDQWLAAAVPLQLLAVYGLINASSQGASTVLFAIGKPNIAASIRTIRFAIMLILLFPLISMYNLMGAAMAVVISALIVQPILWYKVSKVLKITKDNKN